MEKNTHSMARQPRITRSPSIPISTRSFAAILQRVKSNKKNYTPLLHTTTFPTLHHPQHHSTIVNFHLTAMIPLTLPIPTDRLSTHQISSAHASLHFIPPLVPPFSKHIWSFHSKRRFVSNRAFMQNHTIIQRTDEKPRTMMEFNTLCCCEERRIRLRWCLYSQSGDELLQGEINKGSIEKRNWRPTIRGEWIWATLNE